MGARRTTGRPRDVQESPGVTRSLVKRPVALIAIAMELSTCGSTSTASPPVYGKGLGNPKGAEPGS
jgi:hypothetical protein